MHEVSDCCARRGRAGGCGDAVCGAGALPRLRRRLGIVGGVVAGAIIGSAIANSGPAPVYVAPPPPRVVYEEPAYAVGPECHIVKRRIYVEGVGPRWSREEVCD